uniref:Uncharacterized protein n=1 Tax=Oryza rufipogon TaxID=4529 RepID=A0A0E0N1X2_ORYRU
MAPSPDRYTPTPSRLPLALKAAAQAETPTFADNYTPPPSRVDEAHALMEQRMLMEANVVIWGTLLGACERHENVRVGQ